MGWIFDVEFMNEMGRLLRKESFLLCYVHQKQSTESAGGFQTCYLEKDPFLLDAATQINVILVTARQLEKIVQRVTLL